MLETTIRQQYLVCHNDRTRTADLSVAGVRATEVGAQAPVLEKVLRKLRAREKPPAGREIRRRVEAADDPVSALVQAIVDSVPFRWRGSPEPPVEP